MKFRKLRKDDFEQYINLMNEFRPLNFKITSDKFEEIYDIIFRNDIIYVIEKHNELIGTGKLLIEQKFIHNLSKYGHIEDVIIKKKYRKNKYGTIMIKHIVDECKKKNFYKITLTCNKKLISFYKQNNFEVYDIHMSQLLKNN